MAHRQADAVNLDFNGDFCVLHPLLRRQLPSLACDVAASLVSIKRIINLARIRENLLAPRFGTDLRPERVHRSCSFVKRLVPDSAQLYFHPLSCSRFLSLLFGNTL